MIRRTLNRMAQRLLVGPHREFVLGDLDEGYENLAASRGPMAATAWFVVMMLRSAYTLRRTSRRRDHQQWKSRRRGAASLAQDIAVGIRLLGRQPGFTAVAVCTLSLGVGASTAVFSVAHGVLFNQLPYPNADRLLRIWSNGVRPDGFGTPRFSVSNAHISAWRAEAETLEDFISTASFLRTWYAQPGARGAQVAFVSTNFLDFVDVQPALGRGFQPADDRADASQVVMLDYGTWLTEFGADLSAVGRAVRLEEDVYTVIGVMPPGFRFPTLPRDIAFWTTRIGSPTSLAGWHSIVALPKEGITVAQVAEELGPITSRMLVEHGSFTTHADDPVRAVTIDPFHESVTGAAGSTLTMLMGAVTFLLLIACANIANLLLVRGTRREREMAIRAALGAGRGRLIRMLMAEALVLGLPSAVFGFALATGLVRVLLALDPGDIPRLSEIHLSTATLLVSTILTLGVTAAIAVLPALQLTQARFGTVVGSGQLVVADRRGSRTTQVLVVTEVALAAILLVGAGLMMNTLVRLSTIDPGFETGGVLAVEVSFPFAEYALPTDRATQFGRSYTLSPRRDEFVAAVLERIRRAPNVEAASYARYAPLTGSYGGWAGSAESRATNLVTPEYFETLGIPLLAGRLIDDTDRPGTPTVTVINQTLARARWPGEDAVGKRIRTGSSHLGAGGRDSLMVTVVGVVGDVRQWNWADSPEPEEYFSLGHHAPEFAGRGHLRGTFLIKTGAQDQAVLPIIRYIIRTQDPLVAIDASNTMEGYMTAQVVTPRFYAWLLAVFAGLAVVLAAFGLAGVIWHTVTQRTREIGLRIALGARAGQMVWLMTLRSIGTIALGLVFGGAGAIGVTRLLDHLLYGVTSTDPLTFVVCLSLLASVAVLAAYVPARAAARVNPIDALRSE